MSILPFKWYPGSWGLRGDVYKVAEANYLYRGEELERKLAEIKFTGRDLDRELTKIDLKFKKITPKAFDICMLSFEGKANDDRAMLGLSLKYEEISQYDHDVAIAKLDHPKGNDRKLALLAVDLQHDKIAPYDHDIARAKILYPEEGSKEYKQAVLDAKHLHGKLDEYGYDRKTAELSVAEGKERDLALAEVDRHHDKITEHEYEKAVATANEEPWIAVIDSGFDPEQGLSGVYFEFDWNEYWITYLRLNGYVGVSDAAVVDMWFADVCRAQGLNANGPFDNNVVPFTGKL